MKKIKPEDIDEAVAVLEQGGIIIYPTETSYAIGCDARNRAAVSRVFGAKGRPNSKGTSVLIPDIESVQQYIQVSKRARMLMEKHWPGALNVIAPIARKSRISKQCSQGGTQSIRVSSSPIVAELVGRFAGPIVSSSANFSGEPDVYNVDNIELDVDLIVDAGQLEKNPPSTNVRVMGDTVEVIRQGAIKIN